MDNNMIELVKLALTVIGTIATGWLAFKTAALSKQQTAMSVSQTAIVADVGVVKKAQEQVVADVTEVKSTQEKVVATVNKVEIQTNSMSEKLAVAADKLAVAERKVGHSEGRDEALTQVRAEEAVKSQGAAEERNRQAGQRDMEARTAPIANAPVAPAGGPASVVVEGVKLKGEHVDPTKPKETP